MVAESSKSEAIMEEFHQLTELIKSADDRTLAILMVSFIDSALASAVQTRLPGLTQALRKTLFDDGILGPIAARNHIAKALNIITPEQYTNIKILASIRNKFAHQISVTTFDHKDVAGRVDKLNPVGLLTFEEDFPKKDADQIYANILSQPRTDRFWHVSMLIAGPLHNYRLAAHG